MATSFLGNLAGAFIGLTGEVVPEKASQPVHIAALGQHLQRNAPEGAIVVDCKRAVLCPGLIDMQVFTGEPGTEYRETLASASLAAAAGGVTTMIVMPNTQPVIDDAAIVECIASAVDDPGELSVSALLDEPAARKIPESRRSTSTSVP